MTKSGKHCGKRRNCLSWAISSFVTMFSKSCLLQGRQKVSIWRKGLIIERSVENIVAIAFACGKGFFSHSYKFHYFIFWLKQTKITSKRTISDADYDWFSHRKSVVMLTISISMKIFSVFCFVFFTNSNFHQSNLMSSCLGSFPCFNPFPHSTNLQQTTLKNCWKPLWMKD